MCFFLTRQNKIHIPLKRFTPAQGVQVENSKNNKSLTIITTNMKESRYKI